jgi:RNA recognition motif-containing protein
MFEVYGPVDRVNIVTDRDTGQPKGFGFVEMSNDAEGDHAINALSGHELLVAFPQKSYCGMYSILLNLSARPDGRHNDLQAGLNGGGHRNR